MGYGIKIFVPRPLHYVTRSPGYDGLVNLLYGTSFARVLQFANGIGRHVDKPNVKRVISVPYTMEDFLMKLDDKDKWEIIHHGKKAHQ